VIAQGFSTRDVTRLEILVTDVETSCSACSVSRAATTLWLPARSAASLKWLDKTSSWRMRPMQHARRLDTSASPSPTSTQQRHSSSGLVYKSKAGRSWRASFSTLSAASPAPALDMEVHRFRIIYNTIRPHQALGDRTLGTADTGCDQQKPLDSGRSERSEARRFTARYHSRGQPRPWQPACR
jgi:hypothetical protein